MSFLVQRYFKCGSLGRKKRKGVAEEEKESEVCPWLKQFDIVECYFKFSRDSQTTENVDCYTKKRWHQIHLHVKCFRKLDLR